MPSAIVWTLAADYLFIFFARVADVSLGTMRFMLMVRGRRWTASILSFFEITIWVVALGRVLDGLDNPLKIAVYALGFATGVFVGQWVEEKMALGISAVQVISKDSGAASSIRDSLREAGYGVTELIGEGRDGPRRVLMATSFRRGIPRLVGTVRDYDADAFITIMDAKSSMGGYMRAKR